MKKYKIKKDLTPKDFFNFYSPYQRRPSLFLFFLPWITEKFPQKNMWKKIEESFWRKVGKTEPTSLVLLLTRIFTKNVHDHFRP